MPNPHISYGSISNRNPFEDDRENHMESIYGDDGLYYGQRNPRSSPTVRHKGMSHSLSEGNIDFRPSLLQRNSDLSSDWPTTSNDHHVRFIEDPYHALRFSPARGQSPKRSVSPFKGLDVIKEDETPAVYPETPVKRSRSPTKQLFGEFGWLGKSPEEKGTPTGEPRKTGLKHWGEKIKQRVTGTEKSKFDMAKFVSTMPSLRSTPKSNIPSPSRFYVSLSPPQQSKVYSEMDLMISATANNYLCVQQREGRMSVDSLTNVLKSWASKNRPQVIEFMFDQKHQRSLVVQNMKDFHFYGPHGTNIVKINSMLHTWKSLAREMSVRTFCTPDVMVKKNMHDCYHLLELLGAPYVTLHAFNEIRVRAELCMVVGQRKKDDQDKVEFGVEKRWEPSGEVMEAELENPFA